MRKEDYIREVGSIIERIQDVAEQDDQILVYIAASTDIDDEIVSSLLIHGCDGIDLGMAVERLLDSVREVDEQLYYGIVAAMAQKAAERSDTDSCDVDDNTAMGIFLRAVHAAESENDAAW